MSVCNIDEMMKLYTNVKGRDAKIAVAKCIHDYLCSPDMVSDRKEDVPPSPKKVTRKVESESDESDDEEEPPRLTKHKKVMKKVTKVESNCEDQSVSVLKGHTSPVYSLALSADGKLLSGSADGNIRQWNLDTGKCTRIMKTEKTIHALIFSQDGKFYSASTNQICQWDLAAGQTLRVMQGHTSDVTCLAVSADGKWLYSGSDDNTIRTWDVSTGQCIRTTQGHTDNVNALVLSADGKWLYSGSDDKTIRVWDLSTGQCIRTMQGHTSFVFALALSADGKRLYSGSCDKTIRAWDLVTGQTLRVMTGHTSFIRTLVLSADGKRLCSGSGDCTIRTWDLATGGCIRIMKGCAPVHTLVLSDKCLYSGSNETVVGMWNVTQ